MKRNLNFLLYGIAFITILIPMGMSQANYSLSQGLETIILLVGIVFLILGKLLTIQRKKIETKESTTTDYIIILCLIAMAGYLISYFF